jgi:hypothetical protein
MRLIEKKCPNCGATLEFNENDKSCKCNYCKRGFEIERDTDNLDKFNLIYDKMQKPVKTFMMIPFIFAGVVFLIILISFFGFRNHTKVTKTGNKSGDEIVEKQNSLIKDVTELDNDDLDSIHNKCYSIIHQKITGRNDTTYSYQITGDPKLKNIYVAYKEDSNSIISIYEVIYHNFFNQTDQQTVYVPVVFENVKENVLFSLSSGKNPAPEYYLNQDHSSYIYAYSTFDEAYNGVVKPLEEEYTVTNQ